jgi:hypothetical protein
MRRPVAALAAGIALMSALTAGSAATARPLGGAGYASVSRPHAVPVSRSFSQARPSRHPVRFARKMVIHGPNQCFQVCRHFAGVSAEFCMHSCY